MKNDIVLFNVIYYDRMITSPRSTCEHQTNCGERGKNDRVTWTNGAWEGVYGAGLLEILPGSLRLNSGKFVKKIKRYEIVLWYSWVSFDIRGCSPVHMPPNRVILVSSTVVELTTLICKMHLPRVRSIVTKIITKTLFSFMISSLHHILIPS